MARAGLKPAQLVCGLMAVLLSLLSFAGLLQSDQAWWRGDGGAGGHAQLVLTVSLIDDDDAETKEKLRSASTPDSISDSLPVAVDADSASALTGLGYLPVAELSERPMLVQDIDGALDLQGATDDFDTANAVDVRPPQALQHAVGLLLINERGGVDKLLFESPGLPRYLETLLAQRFAAARFLPGKIDGKPVRSAMRIALQLQ